MSDFTFVIIIFLIFLEFLLFPFLKADSCDVCGKKLIFKRNECGSCGCRYVMADNLIAKSFNFLDIALPILFIAILFVMLANQYYKITPNEVIVGLLVFGLVIEIFRTLILKSKTWVLNKDDPQTKIVMKKIVHSGSTVNHNKAINTGNFYSAFFGVIHCTSNLHQKVPYKSCRLLRH